MAKLLELPRLGKYGNWAERHLEEHLPQVRRELKESGQLERYLLNVQHDTLSALESVRNQLRKQRPPQEQRPPETPAVRELAETDERRDRPAGVHPASR